MSQEHYQQIWQEAQDSLKKTLVVDAKAKKKGPIPDLEKAKWLIGHLFMSYVHIVNKLDDCYDQMIHPQKREVIGRLLDLSLGRLLELKSELVRIEYDDYYFFDNVLIELKLTHEDVEIHVPKYFWRDREKAAAHRRKLIEKVFAEAEREIFREQYLKNVPEDEKEEVWEKFLYREELQRIENEKFEEQQRKLQVNKVEAADSLEVLKKDLKVEKQVTKEEIVEAIALIQRHERARQGRIQALLGKKRKALKERGEIGERMPESKLEEAARVIQRHWRRYRRRQKEAKANEKLQLMLGMVQTSQKDTSKKEKLEKVAKIRWKMQERNQKEYEEALVKIKDRVIRWCSIPFEDDIVEELMAWFKWYFDVSGYLPDFPPEKPIIPTGEVLGIPKKLGPKFAEKLFPALKKKGPEVAKKMTALAVALAGISEIGGSALIVAEQWLGPKEFLACQKELEKQKKAGKGGGGEKPAKLSKEEKQALKKKEKELEKKRLMAEEALGFQLRDSSYLVPLNKADRDFRVFWMDLDESKNPDQKFLYDLVKEEKCWEVYMEVRRTVDEMMRLELEALKDALWRDQNPKKKAKKKKPPKKPKEKKPKKKKDPTGDRTLDDLFMELFRNGIIREYEKVHLHEYNGERSYGAFDMRRRLIDWPPSTGDVRDVILQLCILPLGSARIHQLSPLTKSVCLLGTENSGKEFLARIVCTETASVMFDLSPENVAGKYPGKDGLKMLQHLIEKMSRALQPSVIFVDGAEKTFYKKVPKEEKELDPKRLAAMLGKIVKGIKPEDQVLLLGVSSQPWAAKKNKFIKTYQKTIQVPQMDYGSYVKLWQTILAPYHSIPRDFDVSCLARVSEGFSVKKIMETVQKVLTTERISRSLFQPYDQMEFLEELVKTPPMDPKLQEKSFKFYSALEMPKKRAKRLEEIKQEIEKAQKKK